jgi:hypothetical protein
MYKATTKADAAVAIAFNAANNFAVVTTSDTATAAAHQRAHTSPQSAVKNATDAVNDDNECRRKERERARHTVRTYDDNVRVVRTLSDVMITTVAASEAIPCKAAYINGRTVEEKQCECYVFPQQATPFIIADVTAVDSNANTGGGAERPDKGDRD